MKAKKAEERDNKKSKKKIDTVNAPQIEDEIAVPTSSKMNAKNENSSHETVNVIQSKGNLRAPKDSK
jgi:hypothetical protein